VDLSNARLETRFFRARSAGYTQVRQCSRSDCTGDLDGGFSPTGRAESLAREAAAARSAIDPANSARSAAARARCKTPRCATASAEFSKSRGAARPQRLHGSGDGADGRRVDQPRISHIGTLILRPQPPTP